MNTDIILRQLTNSGFRILGSDDVFLYVEDPSCILRSFETFIEYAWIIITCITGILLFGWAIAMIRGAKNDIFTNLRNLVLIFGILAASRPIINTIWGGDLFAKGCQTLKIPYSDINEILAARNLKMAKADEYNLYEGINIYDSGAKTQPNELPYYVSPIIAPEIPQDINVLTANNNSFPKLFIPHSAKEISKNVLYISPDGTQYTKTGGSRAWRNTNPGNIRYSEFSRRMGAIGEAGGFAIFPDEETGMHAIKELLKTSNYNKLTVAGAISRYAPPSENDTAAYHRHIQNLTGLSINKRMSDLTDSELSKIVMAIKTIEGWTVGNIIKN